MTQLTDRLENGFQLVMNIAHPRGQFRRQVQRKQIETEAGGGESAGHFIVQDARQPLPFALPRRPAKPPRSRFSQPRLRANRRRAAAVTSRATKPYLSSTASGEPDSA